MKSAHRHELESNALAHRLEVAIERYKPYGSRIAGVVISIVVLIAIGSYLMGSSSARQSEAWDTFNHAISSTPPNLDEIHRTAQDFPDTKMQQIADVTWADAQVYIASRGYLANRKVAMDTLDKATSAYQSVVQASKDEPLIARARLGLARIYEMQNHLDKAREEYGTVTGAYAAYAKLQAERLGKPDSQETYAWLATAQPPAQKPPMGPGTPGKPPEFSPGEMALPGAGGAEAGKVDSAKGTNEAFDNLLKSLKDEKNIVTPDRYKAGEKPADGSPATPPGKESPTNETKESKDSAPPADAGKGESKPVEKTSEAAKTPDK